jgi:dihydroflavonol-4-reductase
MDDNQIVCVTGASGFVGSHIVRELLDQGYRVRGTVRGAADRGKYSYLLDLPGAAERLELAEADLLVDGCFDPVFAGCTTVIHTASPYVIDVKDPQADLVDPAVEGTLNVLRASERAESVRRVVYTSSMAAITDESRDDKVFTEADWNTKSSLDRNPYYYSKALAERAAWRFMEEGKKGFEMVVLNPMIVIGPSLNPSLNPSNQILRDLMTGRYPAIMNFSWGIVDVRDTAKAHALAITVKDASGRYICAGKSQSMREIVELLRKSGYGDFRIPSFSMTSKLGDALVRLSSYIYPNGTGTYMRTHVGKAILFDNGKIKRELGMEFMPAEQSILDTVEDLLEWGHLKRAGE